MINLPDVEYSYLIEDFAEIIKIYNNQFFSIIEKLVVNALIPGDQDQKSQFD